MKYVLTIFFFLSLCPNLIWAHTSCTSKHVIPNQVTLKIVADRSFYINGETCWFKIYAVDGNGHLSRFSNIAHIELVGFDGALLTRVKVMIKDGLGSAAIELPRDLENGVYVLRAYLREWLPLGGTNACLYPLTIINPGNPLLKREDDVVLPYGIIPGYHSEDIIPGNDWKIAIKKEVESINQRQLVTLTIDCQDINNLGIKANLDVSVRQSQSANYHSVLSGINSPQSVGSNVVPAKSNVEIVSEQQGMILKGRVLSQDLSSGASGIPVFLSFPGQVPQVYNGITNDVGEFLFRLPSMYGLREYILQVLPMDGAELSIEVASEFMDVALFETATLRLPREEVNWMNNSAVNAQIISSYEAFEAPVIYSQDSRVASIPFYGEPEFRYNLDAYTRFPLPEFFFEIVPSVRVKGKFGNERLEIVNDLNNAFKESAPLLLVDGVPVFDQSKFLKINNKLIASVDIVIRPFWLNPMIFNGIIQLTSFDGDARSIELPGSAIRGTLLGLLPFRDFPIFDYDLNSNDPLPDFRNTLYWNPSIVTDENGNAQISFYTSDAIGDFEIQIHGVNSEGTFSAQSDTFTVVKGSQ